MRERVAAHAGLALRQRLAEGVTGPQGEPAGPGEVHRVADLGAARHPEAVAEGQQAGEQVGIAGAFPDAVDAGVYPGVLPRIEVAQGTGHGVRDRHAEVVMAVGLDRDTDRTGQLREPLT